MSASVITYRGGPIFDGTQLLTGRALTLRDGVVERLGPEAGAEGAVVELGGDILAPGYVDLQVNGGDGVMFNDDPAPETLARIAAAHRRLGCAHILPTLITDTAEATRAAIAAVCEAIADGVPGIAGLHLEGPHLSVARKGAHEARHIRPMTQADLDMLTDAARALPVLMVTVAPENVTTAQVAALAEAGAVVSLGHTDADFATCMAYAGAGARAATHLFNAMSQMGSREPGLVGAALASGRMSAGLIADGVHVHPASIRAAFDAKRGPGEMFLVSDAMAPAGTDQAAFSFGGRRVIRAGGRLTLEDGTLAGADLDLTRALAVMTGEAGVAPEAALRMATSVPARLAGLKGAGVFAPGQPAWPIRLRPDFSALVAGVDG